MTTNANAIIKMVVFVQMLLIYVCIFPKGVLSVYVYLFRIVVHEIIK